MLTLLSIYISYSDVRYRLIPNITVLLITIISFILLISTNNTSFYQHILPIVVIGFVLFTFNWVAAGDVKLLAAFSLAINNDFIVPSLHIMLLSGGVIAVCCLIYQRVNRHKKEIIKGVPYGVAICIGSLFGIAASL